MPANRIECLHSDEVGCGEWGLARGTRELPSFRHHSLLCAHLQVHCPNTSLPIVIIRLFHNKISFTNTTTMSAPSASRLLSQATRSASRTVLRSRQANAFHLQPRVVAPAIRAVSCSRSFAFSASRATGLMPDTENPKSPKIEDPAEGALTPAEISDDEFHTLSDAFLEKVHEKAEQVQETREDVEVEFAVSLLCALMATVCFNASRDEGANESTGRRP